MTFGVPFDGSALSQAALSRAVAFASVTDESLAVVSVVPVGNADYVRERGWLSDDESFDRDRVVDRLRGRVAEFAPEATFRVELVDKNAQSETIPTRIRRVLKELDATVVFVGSDNAGRVAATASSVGHGVSGALGDDAVSIRTPGPSPVAAIRTQEPPAARKDC